MLTGTNFEAIAILALLAVAHAVVSMVITRRLTGVEQVSARPAASIITGAVTPTPANDGLRNAA
ncbi:hypothetical protein JL101_002850 [Skermanella rosea]|uniref:hypothetical protein n=1 Tax=Skermanella rosea TaxID=1817965 RepID=UPI001931E964|nr:hypothetical protein [Skermanella rosea]UEM04397.1 hypothetical protein JL101_002850 [Skermanella rosea]